MKKLYVGPIIVTTLLLATGCGNKDATSTAAGSGNVITGVAATGAPISGGTVEIKGSDGDIVEGTTSADGSYSANIANLEEPFLVRVIAPSGEKYVSVASASDLASGKKVNVTPLTHTIVANVFGKSDSDDLFENFETDASSFTPAKLEEEKQELKQKFIDAGLLGAGKIAGDDIDLLNGDFVAGSSDGVDGLLDVIDVNTSASAGIEIKLKGETVALITDKVDGSADPVIVAILPAKLEAAAKQLTVLDELRSRMNALATLHSSKVSCNGAPVDDGSACDVDTLAAAFEPFFHDNYNEDGLTKAAGQYGWFCRKADDKEAVSKNDCLGVGGTAGEIFFENVSLKDISLIHYNNTTKVALINFNFYVNGVLKGSEEMALQRSAADDVSPFQLLGNMKHFEYWIETESLYRTSYNKTTNVGTDNYSVNLKFYLNDDMAFNFVGGETLTLTALSGHPIFPNSSDTMNLYVVVAPKWNSNGSCTTGVALSSTATPYKVFSNGTVTNAAYADACVSSTDPCNCRKSDTEWAHFDHDVAQKVLLSPGQIFAMDKAERISMTGADSDGGAAVNDIFIIKKPMMVNQFNAPAVIPTFGTTAALFCENPSFTAPLNLAVVEGTLSYVSLNHSFSRGSGGGASWLNDNAKAEYWELSPKTAVFTPTFTNAQDGDVIRFSHLYLSARDEHDRQFVRQVSCEEPPAP